jgi:membrane peptidoglycan carboxypeptidase
MQHGFTFNQLIAGYSTLAANGDYVKPAFIRKIVIDDRTIFQRKINPKKVFSQDTAYLTTDMLKTATSIGTAKKLSVLPFDIAAKTGTNGTKNGNYDAYAISYTTLDTIGVWLGNTDNTPIEYTGGGLPCNMSLELHQELSKNYSNKNVAIPNFTPTSNVEKIAIDKINYDKNHELLLADEKSPNEYKIFELFKTQLIPTQQATHFSHPTIPSPSIEVKNNVATITLDINTPNFYSFLIEKHYYASHNTYVTHSTVYNGKLKTPISDKLTDDKSYIYSITPIYKENKGKTIYLPAVSIGSSKPINPLTPPDISSKDWWNY